MEHKIDFAIGGQALIEGVMMRSPSFVSTAVRKKDGSIKQHWFGFRSLTTRYKFFKIPIVRGIVNVCEMVGIGMKAVNFSAEEYAEDEDGGDAAATAPHGRAGHGSQFTVHSSQPSKTPEGKKSSIFEIATMVFSFVISIALALFMFKFIPLAITEWLRSVWPYLADHYILFNLIDGGVRIIIFVAYVFILSLFKTFHRIFEYHGAEHMAVHAYEKGAALKPGEVARENPEHPRCGTSFLLAVFIVSILVYTVVPRHPIFWINLAQRMAALPLIAGLGYEILKWSARHRNHPIVRLVTVPGLLTQKITTQKPDEKQIEVAIAALQKALDLETTAAARKSQPH